MGWLPIPPRKGHIEVAAEFKAWQGKGDYAEFGVYAGKSFVRAYHAIKKAERKRGRKWETRFLAFDSFRGLPKSEGRDNIYERYREGAYSASQEEFSRNIVKHGVNLQDVIVVPGFYEDTLNPTFAQKYGSLRIAMVYLDCDLYSSTKTALEFLTPFLIDGCVVIFADWYLFQANPKLGQQRAFSEWLEKNDDLSVSPFVSVPGEFHASFIVHRSFQSQMSIDDL